MTEPKKLTRAEQKAQRPQQILDAAFEAFVEQGYMATRMEDIAKRIGVTKGTVYVYFETKEELFAAMMRHIGTPFEEVLACAAQIEGSCSERLRGLIELCYNKIVDDKKSRELMRFVISEGSRFPQAVDRHHDEFMQPIFAYAQQIIDEGVSGGEFRSKPAAVADIVVSPVIAMATFLLLFDPRRSLDREAYIESHIDLVLNGLRTAGKVEGSSP